MLVKKLTIISILVLMAVVFVSGTAAAEDSNSTAVEQPKTGSAEKIDLKLNLQKG